MFIKLFIAEYTRELLILGSILLIMNVFTFNFSVKLIISAIKKMVEAQKQVKSQNHKYGA